MKTRNMVAQHMNAVNKNSVHDIKAGAKSKRCKQKRTWKKQIKQEVSW